MRKGETYLLFPVLGLLLFVLALGVSTVGSSSQDDGNSMQEVATAKPQPVIQPESILRAPILKQTIYSTPVPTDTPAPNATETTTRTPWPTETEPPPPTVTPDPRFGAVSAKGLIWPFVDSIASPYGPSHPLGIDIDGYEGTRSREGEPVVAATAGQIIFAGGNPCCSYGLYVVVMSPNGIETIYCHMDAISIAQGQNVEQGQEIGKLGSTGYSTGPHLHFEVIDNGIRQDPLSYLP